MPTNESCALCHHVFTDERTALGTSISGVIYSTIFVTVDDVHYCGACCEVGIRMMVEGRKIK